MRLLLFTLLAVSSSADDAPTLNEVLTEEGSLRSVAFADTRRGCAVGDRGLILRTTDGGDHWRRVAAPTNARLNAVTFLDADHGWAVGGAIRPYTRESRGVLLATTNGGRDWSIVCEATIPRLTSLRFFDKQHGVAAGDGTALHPSGVFTTDDGGRHWRAVPGGESRQWVAGDFARDRLGGLAGAVVGLRGAAARVAGRQVDLAPNAGDRRGGYGVSLTDPAHGWLVGDGGLVLTTDDGGRAWAPPLAEPPRTLADWFDWRAVTAQRERVWIAGSPGSVVLSSSDGGQTWNTTRTGVTTPITALTFVDASHGWAVGELGAILTTRDGGQSWRVQRGEGRRAAAGVVVATPRQLPSELIAHASAADGHRFAALAPMTPSSHSEAAPALSRLAAAGATLGIDSTTAGWSVPLNSVDAELPQDQLLERLDRLTDARTRELLVGELRRWLLAYRPDLVAVPDQPGAASLLAEACREAIARAAEVPPPETRLAPWRVRRLVAFSTDGERTGNEALFGTGEFSPLLGATPAQWAREARGLLEADYTPAPAAYRWRTLEGDTPARGVRPELLAGVATRRGGAARRPAAVATATGLDRLRRIASKRRNMERLLQRASGDPAWAGQVVNLTGGLDAESGAELLRQLAEGYRDAGRYEQAADTLYLLARRYPDAALADASLVWLVRYYASGERAWADARGQGQSARNSKTLANLPSAGAVARLAAPESSGVLGAEERLDRATALFDFLSQARPALHADPAVRFLEAATQRSRGFGMDADKIALVLSKRSVSDAWRRAAAAERWLAKPEGLPPEKPIANCRYTPRRPKLDGRFDDPAWIAKPTARLATDRYSDPTATVRFAHDEEFLYLAIEAEAASPVTIDPSVPRPRDADLTTEDRLRLRIDTDRDYATAFELTIDRRGRTHDALWSDAHWQPTWYVAADADEGSWRIEAAIPLAELTDPEHVARAAWAVSLERVTPGEAPAAWPEVSTVGSPDGFGLLLFD